MGTEDQKIRPQNSLRMGLPWKRGRSIAAATLRTAAAFIILVSMVTTAAYLLLKDPNEGTSWPFQRYCAGKDLLELARQQGIEFPKLKMGYVGERRGVVATQDITRGEVIVRVPYQALFTYPNAGFGEEKDGSEGVLRKIWREFPTLPEVDRLTIAFLYEASLPSSRWDFYVCGVPRPTELGPPVLWDEEKLNAACTGQYHSLCPWVRIRKSFYADWWGRKRRLISRLLPLFPQGTLTLQNFIWAAAAVNSRMWNMRSQGKETDFEDDASLVGHPQWVLGPVAELLNHQPKAGHIKWSNKWDLEVVSDRAVTAGEEVFLSYGDKCNLSLLLEYGFALPENDEWCDERDPEESEKDAETQSSGRDGKKVDLRSQAKGTTKGGNGDESEANENADDREVKRGGSEARVGKVQLGGRGPQGPKGKDDSKTARGMDARSHVPEAVDSQPGARGGVGSSLKDGRSGQNARAEAFGQSSDDDKPSDSEPDE